MSQRLALIVAAAITAFVLVIVGALSIHLSGAAGQTANVLPASAAVTPSPAAAAPDPAIEALLREREAAYQAALAEASARLEAANARIASANQQLASAAQSRASGGTAPVVASATGAAIGEQQAIVIAQRYYGGQVIAVERETEHGALVYEVKFSDRSSVYVDAATGQVVYARIAAGGDDDRFRRERHEGHDD
ncbi:MAG: PepSY domain-containing protein [Oscillochloridaceae bacterium]|nr:PepSY domain-containing protein [Chloroflexaceae bacterium]MDW8388762.1 PepSY domain-containing protein [Oscillochloridaceae bacterium]